MYAIIRNIRGILYNQSRLRLHSDDGKMTDK